MARAYIPESLAELTPDWLTEALRESGVLREVRVTRVESQLLGVGQGFIGEVARLTLHYDEKEDGAPETLIVKLPTSTRTNRGLGNLGGLYEREIRFYREMRDDVRLRTPKHYYSALDEALGARYAAGITRFIDRLPGVLLRLLLRLFTWLAGVDKRRFLLMIEDIAPARLGDQVAGCSTDEARTALRDLARMHAAFWNDPRLENTWWIVPLDLAPNIFRQLLELSRDAFLEQYGHHFSPSARAKFDWFREHDLEIFRLCGGHPFTLVHGDFRLDNMFFDDSHDEIVLFDWQGPGKGLGAFDVAYFLSASLPLGTPPEVEESIVRSYHDELVRGGVKDYPWDEFVRHYRISMILMLARLSGVAGELIELGEDRGLELVQTWIDRAVERVEPIQTDHLL